MKKEVRSQRLTMFLQTVQNPAIAPFVRMSEVIKELAYSLDLDPEEIMNTKDEAQIYAKIIGQQNVNQRTSQQIPDPSQLGPMEEPGGIPATKSSSKQHRKWRNPNLQLIHQCQGRWNLLDKLKNLPSNVRDIKNKLVLTY